VSGYSIVLDHDIGELQLMEQRDSF